MRHRPQLGRADLLACLEAHGEAALDAFATVLGYIPRPPPAETRPAISITPDGGSSTPQPVPTPLSGTAVASMAFFRVVQQQQVESSARVSQAPAWFVQARPYRAEELLAPPGHLPPPHLPLMRWARLWPFCKIVLGLLHDTGTLDIPRLVERLARGQVLRQVPRVARQGWAGACQVIIDYAEPLLPFWADYNDLHPRLRRLRGMQGLTLVAALDGDPEGRCEVYTPQGWRPYDHMRAPAPGTPVLLLSDLGCLDGSTARRQPWRRLGQRLQRLGCQAVALMPCPPRYWDADLTRLFVPVCWDRPGRLPRRLRSWRRQVPAGASMQDDPGAEQLLVALAAAIRVEPALLRAVRYLLPVDVDVGSEAAAWNHARVHATTTALYYAPEAMAHYRAAYAALAPQEAAFCQQVAAQIAAHHAALSPAIGYEEQLFLAQYAGAQTAAEAQRFLERLVKTLHQPQGTFVSAAAAWVQRLSKRQQQQTALWRNEALAAAWAVVNRPQIHSGAAPITPAGLDLARVSWVLAPASVPQRYILRQRGHKLWCEADEAVMPAPDLQAAGSPLGTVQAAVSALQVQYDTGDSAESAVHSQRLDQGLVLQPGVRLRLRTDYEEITITSLLRPAWAEAIGRDAQGLFVSWAGGQRRAYWVPPGSYAVSNRAGERLGAVRLPGYWGDAAEALEVLHHGVQQPLWAEDYGLDDYGLYAGFRVQGVSQRLRWIVPGEFCMGSPPDEPERFDDETPHQVLLTRSVWLADTTCTQVLWQAVMGRNPSHFQGAERPVEQVSWQDVQGFLERLSSMLPEGGWRLPTEAEWEYACRAGTTTPFWFGTQITTEQVNYNGNYPYAEGEKGVYRRETVPVQVLPCNGWGLYQMHGNVWEWCQDWSADYTAATADAPVVDPVVSVRGVRRVLRGGAWVNSGRSARAALRNPLDPGCCDDFLGFRLARGQGSLQEAPEVPVRRPAGRA